MMSIPASNDTGITPRNQQPLQQHGGGVGAPHAGMRTPSASVGPAHTGSVAVGATPAAHQTPRRRDLGVGTLHYWSGPNTPGHTANGSGSRMSGDVRLSRRLAAAIVA